MKRVSALILMLAVLCSLAAVPVSATPADWVIDSAADPFPMDTVIDGDLILTGDCPATVNLINTRVNGTLRVETAHTVDVYFQGTSSCDTAVLQGKTRIYGGKFQEITSESIFFSLQNAAASSVVLKADDSMLTTNSSIGTLTVEGKHTVLGGPGRVDQLIINAPGCQPLLHCRSIQKNAEEEPLPPAAPEKMKVDFQVNPSVSPADSIIHAKVTFTNVPAEQQGDYRIYWYIGQNLAEYDWHFDLKSGAVAQMDRSIHFDGVMEEETVWVRLVRNSDDAELKYGAKIQCTGYSTAPYDAIESTSLPYSIDLIRNQNTVIVYGKDDQGNYTKIVNVFPCSTGYFTETALGDFEIGLQMRWGSLMGDLFGQYCSQFNDNQLFHSVPYRSKAPDDLEFEEYKHLGDAASSGCVRLAAADARWIYYHCYSGTPVHVYDSDTLPVVKPIPFMIQEDSLNRGWDPTDIDPANPTRKVTAPAVSFRFRPRGSRPILMLN